jgi:3-methylcrotonyl-CoA carboxylase alpha subunit
MRRSFIVDDGEPMHGALLRRDEGYALELDGRAVPISLDGGRLTVDGRAMAVHVAREGDTVFVQIDGRAFAVRVVHPLAELAEAAAGAAADTAKAPMPGVVVQVAAAAGQAVAKGETLLVIESMKLQTTIAAWRDGVVEAIHVAAGASFDRGAALATLAPEA